MLPLCFIYRYICLCVTCLRSFPGYIFLPCAVKMYWQRQRRKIRKRHWVGQVLPNRIPWGKIFYEEFLYSYIVRKFFDYFSSFIYTQFCIFYSLFFKGRKILHMCMYSKKNLCWLFLMRILYQILILEFESSRKIIFRCLKDYLLILFIYRVFILYFYSAKWRILCESTQKNLDQLFLTQIL